MEDILDDIKRRMAWTTRIPEIWETPCPLRERVEEYFRRARVVGEIIATEQGCTLEELLKRDQSSIILGEKELTAYHQWLEWAEEKFPSTGFRISFFGE